MIPEQPNTQILSNEYITGILDKYDLLTEYRSLILEAAAQVKANPALTEFVCLLAAKLLSGAEVDLAQFQTPTEEGLAYDFLYLFPAIPTMPRTAEHMHRRHVPEDVIEATLKEYDFCVRMREISQGRPMFDQGRLSWMLRVISCKLIRIGRFKYDLPAKRIENVQVYRNHQGELMVLADGMQVHKCGGILGSLGLEDPNGSFQASITETDNTVTGHPICDGAVSRQQITLSKSDWELCLSKDDPVIAVHIPPWEPFRPDDMEASYRRARKIFKECYPDYPYKAFWCRSWLMSRDLHKILNPGSNILNFQKPYTHYPCESPGLGTFYNVFPKHGRPEDLSTLPEETSLQKSVKKLALNGEYILDYCGFFF